MRHLFGHFNEGGNPNSAIPVTEAHVVQKVKGQLGNHLHILAMGHILKTAAINMSYPVDLKLHYYSNGLTSSRLNETKKDIKTCFSSFKDVDFFEYDDPKNQKKLELSHKKYGFHTKIGPEIRQNVNNNKPEGDKILWHKMRFVSWTNFNRNDVPYISLDSFPPQYLIDRYYNRLQKIFTSITRSAAMLLPTQMKP